MYNPIPFARIIETAFFPGLKNVENKSIQITQ